MFKLHFIILLQGTSNCTRYFTFWRQIASYLAYSTLLFRAETDFVPTAQEVQSDDDGTTGTERYYAMLLKNGTQKRQALHGYYQRHLQSFVFVPHGHLNTSNLAADHCRNLLGDCSLWHSTGAWAVSAQCTASACKMEPEAFTCSLPCCRDCVPESSGCHVSLHVGQHILERI